MLRYTVRYMVAKGMVERYSIKQEKLQCGKKCRLWSMFNRKHTFQEQYARRLVYRNFAKRNRKHRATFPYDLIRSPKLLS